MSKFQGRDKRGRYTTSSRKLTKKEVNKELAKVRRSPGGMAVDENKTAKVVFPKNPTRTELNKYVKSPNRMDLEGHDAPIGSAKKTTVKKNTHPKSKTTPQPKAKDAHKLHKKKPKSTSKTGYAGSTYKRMYDKDNEITSSRAMSAALSTENRTMHDDQRARLKDSRHDEIARNSRWKHDDRETMIEYDKAMWEEQKMYMAGAYRQKKKPSKRKRK